MRILRDEEGRIYQEVEPSGGGSFLDELGNLIPAPAGCLVALAIGIIAILLLIWGLGSFLGFFSNTLHIHFNLDDGAVSANEVSVSVMNAKKDKALAHG